MDPIVTCRHFEMNDSLKVHIREKMSRIEKYLSNINEVHVILAMEKRNYIAEVIVNVNKAKITAKEVNEDNMYTAIDLVVEKIERQARKYKDKHTSHKGHHIKAIHNIFENIEADEKPTSVKTESVFVKPMSKDDAISHIETGDNEFMVFENSDTGKVNVLYKRRDGYLGLIEPENR